MARSPRHITFRVFVALLALSVVAFPAAASGLVSHCRADHSSQQSQLSTGDAPHACCATHDEGSGHGDDADHPSSSGCTKCPHACCRPAVDVVQVRLNLVLDQEVVTPVLFPTEAAHDPVTCDAIFHPPRA